MNYYDFEISENKISYKPYWHDKSNFILKLMLGLAILIIGIVLSLSQLKQALIISLFISFYLFLNAFYKTFIINKTTLLFDKTDNALYKITPLGKQKISTLSNTINITSKSGTFYYSYLLNTKNNDKINKVTITTLLQNKTQSDPEVRFLEITLIPEIELFLNINRKHETYFDMNDCSPI